MKKQDIEVPLVDLKPEKTVTRLTGENLRQKRRSWLASCCPILTTDYYMEYFDVTNVDVGRRLCMALFPFTNRFAVETKENPDLYGPFWIYSTLILMLAVTGNFSRYLEAKKENVTNFDYDFGYIPAAAGVVYGFGLFIPILMAIIMKILGSDVTYSQTVCVYGYSTTVLIPVSCVCIVPSDMVQLIALIYGMSVSTIFLMLNFHKELGNYIPKSRYIVLLIIGGCQVVLLLVFKFYFFQSIYIPATTTA